MTKRFSLSRSSDAKTVAVGFSAVAILCSLDGVECGQHDHDFNYVTRFVVETARETLALVPRGLIYRGIIRLK